MAAMEEMREEISTLLKGIDRYNPENLSRLEQYVQLQCQENGYDLEANLAVLKLYQFNPVFFQEAVASKILLKALTNLPHTDFTLCKCLIDMSRMSVEHSPLARIQVLADMLETCRFSLFWEHLVEISDLTAGITGFEDSIRKSVSLHWEKLLSLAMNLLYVIDRYNVFISIVRVICYVVSITYQVIKKSLLRDLLGNPNEAQTNTWISRSNWKDTGDGFIQITNQEENIKTKNITEKITFESIAAIMANVSG